MYRIKERIELSSQKQLIQFSPVSLVQFSLDTE
jgi:hypothetical protein